MPLAGAVGLSAHSRLPELVELSQRFPDLVVAACPESARDSIRFHKSSGGSQATDRPRGLIALAELPEVDGGSGGGWFGRFGRQSGGCTRPGQAAGAWPIKRPWSLVVCLPML
ncbi:MAG: hypothetical protein R3C56_18795 [Pirellulaceae bacterium]